MHQVLEQRSRANSKVRGLTMAWIDPTPLGSLALPATMVMPNPSTVVASPLAVQVQLPTDHCLQYLTSSMQTSAL